MEFSGRDSDHMLGLTCGFGIRSIALGIRGLAFMYDPQGRRFNGGNRASPPSDGGRRGGSWSAPEMGVVRRIDRPCAGHEELSRTSKEDTCGDRRHWPARPSF